MSKQMCDWRKTIFERDNYTCQICGQRSSKGGRLVLNAHHLESFVDNIKKRFNMKNGLTVCYPCHKKIHYDLS